MRQGGPSNRRPRGRHGGGGPSGGNGGNGGGNGGGRESGGRAPRSAAALRHQSFDSNGPEVRVRGNAFQVYEKYLALARDAQGSGDRVLAENLLQHAEHYYRIVEAINEAVVAEQRQRGGNFGGQPDMPQNYYSTDGQLLGSPVPPPQGGGGGGGQPAFPPASNETGDAPVPPVQEAQVEVRRPAPSPFFTTDELDEEPGGPVPLVARA